MQGAGMFFYDIKYQPNKYTHSKYVINKYLMVLLEIVTSS